MLIYINYRIVQNTGNFGNFGKFGAICRSFTHLNLYNKTAGRQKIHRNE